MVAVSMATMSLTCAPQKRFALPASESFSNPLPSRSSRGVSLKPRSKALQVQASLKEKAVTGLTAAAISASLVIPDVAMAADSSLSPSLKNFLLSIAAGGVVLTAIVGVVVGVANFDPVKRA